MTTAAAPIPMRPTRLQIVLWALVLVTTLALSLYDWNGYKVGTYGDDASYVTNADSLLQGVPYGTLLSPGENRVSQFPFLLPLLLTVPRALFPQSLDALRIIPLLSTLLALSVMFWGWRWIGRGLSYWWGLAVFTITALSPITILHARTVMSEAPFFLVSLLMIVLLEKIRTRPPRLWGIWFSILLVALLYLRTIGWVFIIPWLVYLLWGSWRARLPQLGVAVATVALLLGIVLLTTTVRPIDLLPQEYLAQFNNYFEGGRTVRVDDGEVMPKGTSELSFTNSIILSVITHLDLADKLPYQMESAVKTWTEANGVTFLRLVPGIVGVLLVGLGAVLWVRKTGLTAFQIIVIPYLGLLFFWPWNGSRLFYPVQPQLILAALFGLFGAAQWVLIRLPRPAPRLAGQLVAASVLLLSAACLWLDLRFTRTMLLPGDPVQRAAQIQAIVPAGAVVISTRATSDHLYVDRPLIDIPIRLDSTAELMDILERQGVSFVVTHHGEAVEGANMHLRTGAVYRFVTALQPLIDANVLELKFLDEPNDMAIYYIKPELLDTFQP